MVTQACRLLLRPGDTMIDIGANVGILSVLGSRLVGRTGQVHAFEPQPEISELLSLSARENGFDWLKVYPVAVSAENGRMTLTIPENNYGEASLSKSFARGHQQDISVVTLDSFVSNELTTSVRLLKVDVEGHEEFVFNGSEQLLTENPPDFILFESNSERDSPVLQRAPVKILLNHGYRIYDIVKGWIGLHFVECDANSRGFPLSDNLLAVRRGIEPPH